MSLPADRAIPLLSPPRDLLRRFAAAWADEAARSAGKGEEEILLADPFAGADYPAAAAALPGMAGAAKVLARQGRARQRVLLLEEDPAKVEWLRGVLAPLAVDLREGVAADLQVDGAGPTLLVLDPCSAGALPLPLVQEWMRGERVELLLRFPAAELRRLARWHGSALADLPPRLKRTVEGVSRLLGDARHGWLYSWTAALAGGVEGAIDALAAEHAGRLGGGRHLCRHLRLRAGECTEHLVLVTRRPASVLLLNQVVHGLREDGAVPWPDSDAGAVRYPPRAEIGLFADGRAPVRRERVVDRRLLADSLARRFAGRSARLEEVLRSLVDTDLFAGDVRRALLELRRDGRAAFPSLGGSAGIVFAGVGARAMHHRPSRKRPAGSQELSLALD